jgi:hypothetical protein
VLWHDPGQINSGVYPVVITKLLAGEFAIVHALLQATEIFVHEESLKDNVRQDVEPEEILVDFQPKVPFVIYVKPS